MEIETEVCISNIDEYTKYIKKQNSWSGELEKYVAEELYNINIADYIEVEDGTNNNNFHRFFIDCNHDNNYSKKFMLIN